MRKNRWRTTYLFLIFPLIILGLTYFGILISVLFSNSSARNQLSAGETALTLANELMSTIGFWVIIGVFVWSLISYFFGSKMVMGFAGAKPVTKKENATLYRTVENVSIAAGLPKTPEIYIINDMSLNAFATGTNPLNAKVAISRGLLEKLDKSELEAVMAHEIGHILNRDIRVMMLAVTLVGAIQMVGEILLRSRFYGSSNRSNKNNAGAILAIIGFLMVTVGVMIGTLTRLALSREREYLADATGAHLSNNPPALASALKKIAGDARLETLDGKASMAGLCIADPTEDGHSLHQKELKQIKNKKKSALVSYWQKAWSTHPPVSDRIQRLMRY